MTITKENKEFIDRLLEHYIEEAVSYRQIAENFGSSTDSVKDITFGIITGCIYSGFMQAYQSQQKTPGLDDMKELYKILNYKAPAIKKAILDQKQDTKPAIKKAILDQKQDTKPQHRNLN